LPRRPIQRRYDVTAADRRAKLAAIQPERPDPAERVRRVSII
jgi:hypothetical protein